MSPKPTLKLAFQSGKILLKGMAGNKSDAFKKSPAILPLSKFPNAA